MRKIAIACSVLVLLFGCKGTKEMFKPDYSSPESVYKTAEKASKKKEYEMYYHSLSKELQQLHGKDYASQIKSIRNMIDQASEDKKSTTEIVGVEYGNYDGYDAKIIVNQYVDGKLFRSNGVAPAKKENGLWKLTVDPANIPAPADHPAIIENKRILETNYKLDLDTKIIYDADKDEEKLQEVKKLLGIGQGDTAK